MYKVLSIDTVSEGFSGQPVKKRKRIKGPKSLADTKMPPPIDLGFLGQPQPISLNGHCSTEMNQKDAFFLECYPLLSGQSQASQRLLSELYSCINGMCPEPPFSLNEKDPLLEASFSEINRKISEYLLDNPDQNRGFSIRLELILKILFNKIKTSNGNWGLCIAQVLKILPEQVWSQSLSNYMFKNLYGIDSFYFNTAIIETMIEVMPLKLLRDERTRIKEYLQQKGNGSCQAPLIQKLAGRCVATVQDKSDSMSLYDQMKSKLALHEQVHLES